MAKGFFIAVILACVIVLALGTLGKKPGVYWISEDGIVRVNVAELIIQGAKNGPYLENDFEYYNFPLQIDRDYDGLLIAEETELISAILRQWEAEYPEVSIDGWKLWTRDDERIIGIRLWHSLKVSPAEHSSSAFLLGEELSP